MRRMLFIFLTALTVAVLTSSCSRGGDSATFGLFDSGIKGGGSGTIGMAPAPAEAPQVVYDVNNQFADGMSPPKSSLFSEVNTEVLAADSVAEQSTATLGELLIYTSEVSVESMEFNETMTGFHGMVKEYGAFFETSFVSGMNNPNARPEQMRYANYTVRVPKEHFQAMLDRFYSIGNVLYVSTTATNITAQFYDTESRLTTYKTEESRLFVMLEKAATVEEMILVESRLSEVRYQIESLTASLRNWQNQVDYCTISVSIREVAELSVDAPYPRTYAQELAYGVRTTINYMGEFFKTLFRIIVVLSPVLLVLAVAFIIVLVIRKRRGKRGKRHSDQIDMAEYNVIPEQTDQDKNEKK